MNRRINKTRSDVPARRGSNSGSGFHNERTADFFPEKKRQNVTKSRAEVKRESIPETIDKLICAYIRKKTGKDHRDSSVLERIRQSVSAQKASYWKEKPGKRVKYNRAYDIFAYLSYHLPVYFTQFKKILEQLSRDHLLPDDAKILDIGAGPGVVPLAAMNFWREHKKNTLDIYALEQSQEHIEAFTFLTSEYRGSDPLITVHPVFHKDLLKIKPMDLPGVPDDLTLISFQNVIAELEQNDLPTLASLIHSYASLLEENGFLIIIEPAEMRHATNLRRLQTELIKTGLYPYAPCTYPWGTRCNPLHCWTFQEENQIKPTEMMNLLAGERERFRFHNTDIKFSYLIMSKSNLAGKKYCIPQNKRLVKLSQINRYYRRIISVIGARMSSDIGSRGIHIFKICDGTCHESVYIVISDRNRRPGHSALFASSYGDLLVFSNVLVKRHEKHNTWNLILGEDSLVEPMKAEIPDLKNSIV